MSRPPSLIDDEKNILKRLRIGLTVSGAIAVALGMVMIIWPGKTAAVFTMILAIYALVSGVLYVVLGIASTGFSGWSRAVQIVAGMIFIVTAILAFMSPATAAASLSVVVVIFIAVAWIAEGIAALSLISGLEVKGWTVFYAVVSILGGSALLITPLTSAVVFWEWIAVLLVALGVVQVIRAIRLR